MLYPTYQTVEGELWVPMAIAAAALVLYTMFGPGVRSRREAELKTGSRGIELLDLPAPRLGF